MLLWTLHTRHYAPKGQDYYHTSGSGTDVREVMDKVASEVEHLVEERNKMFEVNQSAEITAITDEVSDDRSAVVIDNFYENPEEVRQLALKLERKKDIPFNNHPNGIERAAYETELRKNVEHLIKQILFDDEHWGRNADRPTINENMQYMWFLVEYLNEQVMVDQPDRLIPFQLWYEHNPSLNLR